MPLPQVNDRLKEVPAQALRTVFATIGQLLLVADRIRARAAGQIVGQRRGDSHPASGSGPGPCPGSATPPLQPRPSQPGQPRRLPRPHGGAHWIRRETSGCSTGAKNRTTRTCPASPGPFLKRLRPRHRPPSTRLLRLSQPSPPSPPYFFFFFLPRPSPPCSRRLFFFFFFFFFFFLLSPPCSRNEPALPGSAPSPPAAAVGEALPVSNYDQFSVPSLRARLRVLDADQVQTLLDYEKAHETRPAVITMFERRLTKLGEGN